MKSEKQKNSILKKITDFASHFSTPASQFNVLKCENAQALVEFMIVFPVFLLLVFGIIEFSLLSLASQNVNYAAFKCARTEIVDLDPKRTAWIHLYWLTPHWIQGISPFEAFKIQYPVFNEFNIDINNKFSFFKFAIGTPCLLKIFGVKEPMFNFGGLSFTLFGDAVTDLEGFINALLKGMVGTASKLLNGAVDEFNEGISDAGYAMPPFLRKFLYAMSLIEVKKTEEDSDSDTPTVNVEVTYYYILKFPVIQSIVKYLYHQYGFSDPDIHTGSGSKWDKAKQFSEKSGLSFIPITHSCTMGNEKKMGK